MTRKKHRYFVRVADCLGQCQLIELELKLYISQALELIAKFIAGRVPFKMTGTDYKDASLERLIDVFKKLSNNPALQTKLTKFKDERNFVAHKAIALCLDPNGDLKIPPAAAIEQRLFQIEREAAELTRAIQDEAAKFIAHFYF